MTTEEKKAFIQSQIDGLEAPIYQHTLLQKAYKAGGENTKEQFEKASTVLGSLIAVRESLEEDLKSFTD